MNYWYFILPFFGAFIGWIINKIAFYVMFHPVLPKKILGLTFQGLFPKRQQQLAEKLGRFVKTEFSSIDIEEKISDPANLQKAMPLIEVHVDDFLRIKLKEQMPMISMFIGDKTIGSLKAIFMKELETLFPEVMKHFAGNMKAEFDIEKIVVSKVAGLDPGMIENMLAKELRVLTISGAFTGFLVGLLQIVIALLVK
jgi:uncharacterized membrane protein YheB (UPF0754 family)